MNKFADEYLMDKVKEGDVYKLGLLFERHNLALYNFFFQFSRDKMQSQDLTQNVFYKILKYKHTYKSKSSFKTWMFRIARNARIDSSHKNRFNEAAIDIDGLVENQFLADTLMLDDKTENNLMLHKSIRRLDDDKKELIIMHFFQKMKAPEIAEIMETNANNIRVKTHRALAALREEYEKISKTH